MKIFVGKLWMAFFISIFLFLLIPSAQAQSRNTISGIVFDNLNRPVGQIEVELQDDLYRTLFRAKTNGSGRYIFSGMSPGRFYIRVLPFGTNLEPQTQEVEIVNFFRQSSSGATVASGSANEQKDFYLRLKKEANLTPTVNEVIFVQDVPEDAKKAYEKAIDDLNNKKQKSAITELQRALNIFPDYFLALEALGREYINQNEYEKAGNIFGRAVKINSKSVFSWYGLSYINYALKKFDAAVEAGAQTITLNKTFPDAFIVLGQSLRALKRYHEAEESFLSAKKITSNNPNVHWNLALLYAHNLNRYNDAANELELFLKADPKNPNAENIKKLIKQFRSKKD